LETKVVDTISGVDIIDRYFEIDTVKANEKAERRPTLTLDATGLIAGWLIFIDACIMQSCVRGGNFYRKSLKAWNRFGSRVACSLDEYAASHVPR
jgi:hypothetical protein